MASRSPSPHRFPHATIVYFKDTGRLAGLIGKTYSQMAVHPSRLPPNKTSCTRCGLPFTTRQPPLRGVEDWDYRREGEFAVIVACGHVYGHNCAKELALRKDELGSSRCWTCRPSPHQQNVQPGDRAHAGEQASNTSRRGAPTVFRERPHPRFNPRFSEPRSMVRDDFSREPPLSTGSRYLPTPRASQSTSQHATGFDTNLLGQQYDLPPVQWDPNQPPQGRHLPTLLPDWRPLQCRIPTVPMSNIGIHTRKHPSELRREISESERIPHGRHDHPSSSSAQQTLLTPPSTQHRTQGQLAPNPALGHPGPYEPHQESVSPSLRRSTRLDDGERTQERSPSNYQEVERGSTRSESTSSFSPVLMCSEDVPPHRDPRTAPYAPTAFHPVIVGRQYDIPPLPPLPGQPYTPFSRSAPHEWRPGVNMDHNPPVSNVSYYPRESRSGAATRTRVESGSASRSNQHRSRREPSPQPGERGESRRDLQDQYTEEEIVAANTLLGMRFGTTARQ